MGLKSKIILLALLTIVFMLTLILCLSIDIVWVMLYITLVSMIPTGVGVYDLLR